MCELIKVLKFESLHIICNIRLYKHCESAHCVQHSTVLDAVRAKTATAQTHRRQLCFWYFCLKLFMAHTLPRPPPPITPCMLNDQAPVQHFCMLACTLRAFTRMRVSNAFAEFFFHCHPPYIGMHAFPNNSACFRPKTNTHTCQPARTREQNACAHALARLVSFFILRRSHAALDWRFLTIV
jgi:hypothetical protein